MIEARNIAVRYGSREALRGACVKIDAGDFVAVLGANGAGKSTLLKSLSGLLKPVSGEVLFNGKNISDIPVRQLAKMRAVLEQECGLEFDYTVAETVLLGGYSRAGFWGRAENEHSLLCNCLLTVGLEGFEGRLYTALSGGEKRRVQLARALFQMGADCGGKALFLDEPSAGLDPFNAHCAMRAAARVADGGACVLAVLHDPNLALSYSTKAVLMKDGNVFASGNSAEVVTPENLEFIYGTSCEGARSASGRFVVFPAPGQ